MKSLNCLRINHVIIVLIQFPIFFLVSTILNLHETTEYGQLLAMPKFSASKELFIRAGWHFFLTNLQGHDDVVSLQFTLGFDGHTAKVGSLEFKVMEESIAQATGLPRTGDCWFKNFRLLRKDYDYVFKPKFLAVKGENDFSKLWVREEFLNSLVIITKLITCEGRFSTLKACHFFLLAHFEFGKLLNFPFYFWKSLGKMASQVRKNLENLTHSLYHHGIIKILILVELKKKD